MERSPDLGEEDIMRTLTLKVKRGCIVVITIMITINTAHLGITICLDKIIIFGNLELTFL